jgi:hypothetical protein
MVLVHDSVRGISVHDSVRGITSLAVLALLLHSYRHCIMLNTIDTLIAINTTTLLSLCSYLRL